MTKPTECQVEERQTIIAAVVNLEDKLKALHVNLDSLVDRSPCGVEECDREQLDNIFTEIIYRLSDCAKDVDFAIEKVRTEIANKVH